MARQPRSPGRKISSTPGRRLAPFTASTSSSDLRPGSAAGIQWDGSITITQAPPVRASSRGSSQYDGGPGIWGLSRAPGLMTAASISVNRLRA